MKYACRIIGVLAVMAAACTPKEETLVPDSFQVDDQYLSMALTQERTVAFIPVRSHIPETEWIFSSTAEEWCNATWSITADKGIMVSVAANDDPATREASVTVTARSNQVRLQVVQTGTDPTILVSPVTVGPEGGEVVMTVVSNIAYIVGVPQLDAEDGGEWCTALRSDAASKAFAETAYRYAVEPSVLPYRRTARIELKAVDPSERYQKANTVCVITQGTVSSSPEDVFSDTKLQVLSVKANQTSAYEGSVDNLIDGVYGSYYHSPWGIQYEDPTTTFPVVFEFEFDGTQRIDYMYIMHRAAYNNGTITAGSGNGRIGKFNVYYRTADDADYRLWGQFDFGQAGGYRQAVFAGGLDHPVQVKLEVLDGSGDNGVSGGFVSPAEVEFFNSNKDEVNEALAAVFADGACMELKPGITRQDIVELNRVAPYFASYVAIPLLDGTYTGTEYEFRAHAYEPYSIPSDLARRLVTNIYTSMDNPTGIEVAQGEELLVCVDQVPAGQAVSLAIYGDNGDEPNYGGMAQAESVNQVYALSAGLNSVKVTASGMAYIYNWAEDLSASSVPVKVHILPGCGTVQGYFDLARHDDDRYRELLSKYGWKYFLLKGAKAELLVHTATLKSVAPGQITAALNAWDNIVRWEHELSAIDTYRDFNNHMMAVSTTQAGAYMDASNRRIHISTSAFENLLTEEGVLTNEWGVAHEYGHLNQKAINWKSTTESSNNLFSNYVRYKIGRTASRGERLSVLGESYAKGCSWLTLGSVTTGSTSSSAVYQGEDAELHMRMNWQLWNYYHRCGNKTDFFPTLFELLRKDPLPNDMGPVYFGVAEDNGACQLKYYEKACDAAGEDLTEFFDTWGFFRPVDQQFDQYGTVQYRVTQQMVDASKARVAAKGYPKAAAIQYIEDRQGVDGIVYSELGYYTVFQDKVKVTGTPQATVSGSSVKVSGCDGAVAIEVRRNASGGSLGELLYFSNLTSFTAPVSLSGTTLYAVQYDGTRIPINR